MWRWRRAGKLMAATLVVGLFALLVTAAQTADATNPTTMSFQGKVVNANGTNVTDGTYGFVFKLYTVSSGGSAIWTETDSSVTVTAGVFQVNLGANCPFFTANACNGGTPVDFNANPNLYLGITFNSDPAGEMSPRVQLQSVPFAFNADKVGGLSVSQLAQLSPAAQQTGAINVSAGGTFGGALSVGGTSTLSGAVTLGSTSSAASLLLNDGTVNNYAVTLNTAPLTASYNLTLPQTGPGTSQCLKAGATTASQLIFSSCDDGGEAFLANNQTFTGQDSFAGSGNGSTSYGALFKNATNSATAFAIQRAAGTTLLSVDTLNSITTVGSHTLILNSAPLVTSYPGSPSVVAGANSGGTLSGSSGTTYYYIITAVTGGNESAPSNEVSINGSAFTAIAAPASAPTSAQSNGSGLTGTYCYEYTFVTADGETTPSPTSNCTTISNKRMNVTGIGTGPTGTVSRNLYRTTNGGSSYFLDTTIADNATTNYTDTTADGSLGAAAPTSNTGRLDTNQATINFTTVAGATSYNIYRGTSSNGESSYQTVTTPPFTDSGAAGTAGTPPANTNVAHFGINTTTPTAALDVVGDEHLNGALTVDAGSTFNGTMTLNFTGSEALNINSDLAGNVSGLSFIGTPSATAGTTNGAFIQQANSANPNGLDNGLVVDNANSTTAIGNAISITNSGGAGYTNYISSPNFILAGTGQMFGKGFDYFDPTLLTQGTGLTGLGSGGSAGGNFGGAFSSGAFIGNTDSYAQEFVGSIAAATTNNANAGDDGLWYFNNNAQASITGGDVSTAGGYYVFSAPAKTNRAALLTQGATPGTQDKPLAAANLPIVQMKARISATRITDDLGFGMMDTATASVTNDFLPANGIVFWTNNSTGATSWQGVIRSGSTTRATVTCPASEPVTAGQFATGRIVVMNSTTVRFFIDSNASDGVNLVDCGTATVTAANMPSAAMAMGMYLVQTVATATTADLDYARFWQDDAPPASPSQAAADSQTNQTLADVATGSDTVLASDPTTADGVTTATDTTAATDAAAPLAATPVTTDSNVPATADISHFSFDAAGNATLAGNLNLNAATLNGGLTVGGDVTVAGLSTFQKLATFLAKTIFRQDVEFNGHVSVASDSAGYARLRAGETTVHVKFNTPYDNPPIVSVSPTDGQFVVATSNNVATTGFDITLQNPAAADITLSWTAIGALNPQTATNPSPGATTTSN